MALLYAVWRRSWRDGGNVAAAVREETGSSSWRCDAASSTVNIAILLVVGGGYTIEEEVRLISAQGRSWPGETGERGSPGAFGGALRSRSGDARVGCHPALFY